MNRYGLVQRYKLFDWNKYSKDYKKKYKEENKKALANNTAIEVTFNKIQKPFGGIKEPEIEDVVALIKLGNNNCSDEDATKIIEEALNSDELYEGIENIDKASGMLLIFLTLIICFYNDLNISNDLKCRAIKIKEIYISSINKKQDEEDNNDKEDNDVVKDTTD